MSVNILMPALSPTMEEGTLARWLVKEGDRISSGDLIAEIETDKATMEFEAVDEGIVGKLLVSEGSEGVKVNSPIAIILDDGEQLEASETTNLTVQEEPKTNSTEEAIVQVEQISTNIAKTSSKRIFATPLAKRLAKEKGLNLESISGSGPHGRIVKNDILSFISNRSVIVEKSIEPKIDIQSINKFEVSDFSDEVIEMTKMGKIISNHMTQSVKTSAHVQSFIEVDVTNIYNWRSRVKSRFESREGQKFTFTPIFIEAVAVALRQYPMMNISVDENKIILKKKINIGMATALSDGNLIVPVIKNADQLNLVGMAKTVNDLASRARNNNLNPDDVSGGTYTITNVGVFGSIMGTPIINQPQVGILAFGAIRKMPSVIETEEGDYIGIRKKMIISHSYDHRVVNGALGSKFIKAVKEYLENWNSNREI